MRQAKRCFVLGTRLRGCDRYLVLQKSRPFVMSNRLQAAIAALAADIRCSGEEHIG